MARSHEIAGSGDLCGAAASLTHDVGLHDPQRGAVQADFHTSAEPWAQMMLTP
ncbi:hypothetical protein [Streptomyces albidus (ex Kaewkla and Franco 2022)]|uniref:hypothetical protein n=1 Tax=Streptomyces albidus (ex Kaewkla and Franco 2022) TaxID=722709 RepID=UPI0015EEE70A|nr:hypothetical protein [Streptomyces albidus (ex Kaewkla and Franco 2022)]